jgi:hypothetical protein
MTRYAFTNADGIVVQLISGALNPAQQAQFLRDYSALFGAVAIVAVEPDTSVWIGGAYLDGVFAPPPQPEPEPEPEIVEGTSEVIEEPAAMIEETTPEPEATEPEL